ncbi:MAG: transcriptional regulator, TetR family [Phenylobacterium sp.]|nr:transcriptional regulator, TetR family [Phenylobacterium sp.]
MVGLRQSQKAATRERVVAAARDLFGAQGYEGATVRQIATLAGVSVGSVFTNFASKGEILSEVMQARLEALYAEMDRFVPHLRGSTADRLRSMFAVLFAFEVQNVQLFLAHVAAAYDWTLAPGARPFGRNARLRGLIEECLRRGVEVGEVDPAADLQAIIELLVAAYAWTYRLAAWENATAQAMTEEMDRQIALLATGFAARA